MTKQGHARLKCRIRGCRETCPPGSTDRWICKPHFDVADGPIQQAWFNAVYATENTDRGSEAWPRVVAEHRGAWSNLLKSAQYNSLKRPRAAKAASAVVELGPRAQRKAAREAVMNSGRRKEAGIKQERQRGPVALEDDDRRFEIPLYILFNNLCRLQKEDAAYLTMLLIGPLELEGISDVGGVAIEIVAAKTKALTYNGERRYAERIAKKTQEVVERGLPAEVGWLAQSVTLLAFLIKAHILRNVGEFNFCMSELRRLGWDKPAREILSRADAVRQSNYPPHVGLLSQAVASLVDGLQLLRSAK